MNQLSDALPPAMTAIAISRPGGPEVLQPVKMPVPQPRDGEVLIRVAAAGINAPDLAQRRGSYAPPPDASPLPGLEVSGVRIDTGESVVALCNGGGYADYVAVPAGQVLPLPKGWSFEAGAALPETFFTVQQTLVMRAGLAPGMSVLIHGAAGGIGGAAIQICRVYGASPIAVVSSQDKADYARMLGADAVIDHSREDFVERARALTDGRGVERVLDMVGGDYLARNMVVSARGGHIVQIAALDQAKSEISAGQLVMKWLTLSGSTLRPQDAASKAAIAASLLAEVWPALADGRIRPPRLRVAALQEAARAHAAMEERANYGKIVLRTAFGQSRADNSIENL
jgi:putative PIG3 family NAD(P)H quinone oxidoreductase